MLSYDTDIMEVAITSSLSFHMVLKIFLNDEQKSIDVSEVYNRLGTQVSLNWFVITEKHLLVPYFDKKTSLLTIGLYNRSSSEIRSIHAGVNFSSASDIE